MVINEINCLEINNKLIYSEDINTEDDIFIEQSVYFSGDVCTAGKIKSKYSVNISGKVRAEKLEIAEDFIAYGEVEVVEILVEGKMRLFAELVAQRAEIYGDIYLLGGRVDNLKCEGTCIVESVFEVSDTIVVEKDILCSEGLILNGTVNVNNIVVKEFCETEVELDNIIVINEKRHTKNNVVEEKKIESNTDKLIYLVEQENKKSEEIKEVLTEIGTEKDIDDVAQILSDLSKINPKYYNDAENISNAIMYMEDVERKFENIIEFIGFVDMITTLPSYFKENEFVRDCLYDIGKKEIKIDSKRFDFLSEEEAVKTICSLVSIANLTKEKSIIELKELAVKEYVANFLYNLEKKEKLTIQGCNGLIKKLL